MVNFGTLTAESGWRVWGTPANFNGFRAYIMVVSHLEFSKGGHPPLIKFKCRILLTHGSLNMNLSFFTGAGFTKCGMLSLLDKNVGPGRSLTLAFCLFTFPSLAMPFYRCPAKYCGNMGPLHSWRPQFMGPLRPNSHHTPKSDNVFS